ncbi:MATE family efflux transporter [Candidatus Sumerlaeota bacterium]|nr:MATE family efflux transporter [Candidatus Sumerlaeota bacterium]
MKQSFDTESARTGESDDRRQGGLPARLVGRPVGRTLVGMAAPMLGGTFAMTAFNLADTYFVSRLGTIPLAAMAFTFPVVMIIASISMGLGTGATAVVSHALGRDDQVQAQRLTTHTLVLAVVIVVLMSIGGLWTIDPVFRMLGANERTLPLIHQYMVVWYLGVVFMVLPMMMNNIVRATGDTVSPSLIMVIASVLNVILDPIMIFGLWGFPRWGIRGAAVATIVSRAVSGVLILWVLHRRHRLLHLFMPTWRELRASWAEVLHIGLPCCLTNLLMPIAGAIVTRIVAGFGAAAVAACGAAGRVEMFAFMVPMALGISLVPFVGQNYGAKRLDRVIRGRLFSNTFAFIWGGAIYLAFALLAHPIAQLFSRDAEVVATLTLYLRIVPIGYGMMEIHRYTGFFLNGVRKPLHATGVNVLRIVGLLVPLSLAGAWAFGIPGLFWGRVVADVLSALAGLGWGHAVLKSLAREIQEKRDSDTDEPEIGRPHLEDSVIPEAP